MSERGSAGPPQLLSSLRWIRVAPFLIIRDEDYADLSASLLLANEEPRPARWDCGRRGEDFSAFNAWQARGRRFPSRCLFCLFCRLRVGGCGAVRLVDAVASKSEWTSRVQKVPLAPLIA